MSIYRNPITLIRQEQVTYDVLRKQINVIEDDLEEGHFLEYPEDREYIRQICHILSQAHCNAWQTLDENPKCRDSEWDEIFKSSIGVMLCTGEYKDAVQNFFTQRGISW